MSQPDDEDTKEHPVYPPPPEPAATEGAPEPPATDGPAESGPPADAPPADAPTAAPAARIMEQPVEAPLAPPAPAPWQPPQAPVQQPAEPPTQQWQQPLVPPPAAPPSPQPWQQQPAGWQAQQPQQQPQQWQGPPPGYAPPPPGYAPPPGGYGAPPPGWAGQPQQQWVGPQYSTSALVALAALVLVAFGILIAVIGAWSLTQGPEISRFIRDNDIAVFGTQIDRETMRAILTPMPGVLMVIGLLQLIVGAGVFAHKGWGRALGVLLSILGVLVGIFAVSTALALAPGVSVPMLIAIVLLLGYAFVLLALMAGGSHFRARYQGG